MYSSICQCYYFCDRSFAPSLSFLASTLALFYSDQMTKNKAAVAQRDSHTHTHTHIIELVYLIFY